MNPSPAEEFGLLSTCAFRFRALDYFRDHPEFSAGEALTRLTRWGDWPATSEERMALFFLLRFCGAEEPRDGLHWKAFRELFLELCLQDVPAEYASEPHCEEWVHFYQSQVLKWRAYVSDVHESTSYPQVPTRVS